MMGREDGDVLLVDAKGVYRSSFFLQELKSPMTIIKYPIRGGASTENVQTARLVKEVATITMTVTENVPIEVPAGRFNTVQVEIAFAAPMSSTDTVTTWYADGVGMVKQKSVFGATVTTVLKSYRLR